MTNREELCPQGEEVPPQSLRPTNTSVFLPATQHPALAHVTAHELRNPLQAEHWLPSRRRLQG